MSKKQENKLIMGAAILGIAGIIVKVIGAVFRLPLTNWIGSVGMSYYGFAYIVYSALLVLATSGMPVAISRLVAEKIALGQYRNAHNVFKVSLKIMSVIGIFSFSVCYFGSDLIAEIFGNPDAAPSLRAIAPALLFVPILAASRGYFQGRQNMNPTAISEVIEQSVRAAVGLTLAFVLLDNGLVASAAGASFGASAGSFAALIVLGLIYLGNRKIIYKKIRLNDQYVESDKVIFKRIVYIAVPIIIGAEIMPIMGLIDTGIIMNRLQSTGWTLEESKYLFGLFSGFVNPVIALPQIFTVAVAVSSVPAISGKFKVKDMIGVRETSTMSLRMTMIMAAPCALGIFALSKPILFLLYYAQKESAEQAAPIMMIMAVGVLFLALSQTLTGILQAVGKQTVPVKNLLIGCLFKLVITYILVGIKTINVTGAAIGTLIAYAIAFLLNLRSVRSEIGIRIDIMLTYVKPMIAGILMGVVAYLVQMVLEGSLENNLSTLIAVIAGGVVYVSMIFILKAVTLEEAKTIPGVKKLVPYIEKISIWR